MGSFMKDTDFKTYLFSYHHDGSRWNLEIPAKDEEDAKMRLAKLAYAQFDGELIAKLPAQVGFLAWFLTSVRNFFKIWPPA